MADNSTTAAQALLDHHPSEAAFNQSRAEIEAVDEANMIHINVNVVEAITVVLGSLPEIRALRSEIAAELARFDMAQFDSLERYALALNHAHTLWRTASVPKIELTDLAGQLETLRDRLLMDAQSLAAHGLVPSDRLHEPKSVPGYKPLASDVLMLVNLIKSNWTKVEGNTPLTLADLNGAATLALEFLASVGEKDQAPQRESEAALTRQKAFTLFRRAYDAARRAVVYVRDEHGDADEIAPSLYSGRGKRPPPQQDAAPQATIATPVAGNGAQAASIAVDNAAGLPITPPFQN